MPDDSPRAQDVARRLRSDNFKAHILRSLHHGGHPIHITLAYDQRLRVNEIAFVGRSTIGATLDQLLVDAGIMISRAIQHRDPMTGEAADPDETRFTIEIKAGDQMRRLALELTRLQADPPGDGDIRAVTFKVLDEPAEDGTVSLLKSTAFALSRILAGTDPDTGVALIGWRP